MSGDPEKKVKDKSQNEKKIYLPTKLFTKNSSLKDKNSSRMSVSKTQTTERKMSQGWNACFLPQSIQVPIRHLKECSASLTLRERQFTCPMRYHLTLALGPNGHQQQHLWRINAGKGGGKRQHGWTQRLSHQVKEVRGRKTSITRHDFQVQSIHSRRWTIWHKAKHLTRLENQVTIIKKKER